MKEKNVSTKIKEAWNYYMGEMQRSGYHFIKWSVLAILTGGLIGVISSIFGHALSMATSLRKEHSWLLFGLPLAGVMIVFLYKKFGKDDGGTNQVFSTVRARDEVPATAAPLIFISTTLTHLTGGSAGREGAAIQLGGSIANQMGRFLKMDEEDTHIIVMCGMSAAFAALFGTPMAAAIFSLEVISVGVMYYTALMPCLIASLMAASVAGALGIHAEHFFEGFVPELTVITGIQIGIVVLACSIVSILFCMVLRLAGKAYGLWFQNHYIRIAAAAVLIIVLNLLLRTTDYMGAGTELIVQAVQFGKARPLDFFWKLVLTALTMKAGYKGGEIVPSFCIGATLGCVMGQWVGFEPRLCAACGGHSGKQTVVTVEKV